MGRNHAHENRADGSAQRNHDVERSQIRGAGLRAASSPWQNMQPTKRPPGRAGCQPGSSPRRGLRDVVSHRSQRHGEQPEEEAAVIEAVALKAEDEA